MKKNKLLIVGLIVLLLAGGIALMGCGGADCKTTGGCDNSQCFSNTCSWIASGKKCNC